MHNKRDRPTDLNGLFVFDLKFLAELIIISLDVRT